MAFFLIEIAEVPLSITPFPERVTDIIRIYTGSDVKRVVEVEDVHVSGRFVKALADVTLWRERGQ